MRILIVTPAKRGSRLGNQITASRWSQILRRQKHVVSVKQQYDGQAYDLLIALHARKSANSVVEFGNALPSAKVVVALTGTDVHHDLGNSQLVDQSIRLADRIVALEPEGLKKLDKSDQRKSVVIFQSANPVSNPPKKLTRFFEVSILGHLRPVKDPFRTAIAVRKLPKSSKVKVVHFGVALTPEMERRALRESEQNGRYHWYGSVPHGVAQRRLARSRLTVLTSKSEGGPAAIVEAIVNDVPILGTRIDSMIGMLGDDYPGLFDYGDTAALTRLIEQAEADPAFYRSLLQATKKRKPLFTRSREAKTWRMLISEMN